MSGLKLHGLDEMMRNLEQLQRKAEALDGIHELPLSELFPPSFMQQYTSVQSFEELIQQGREQGFVLNTPEDLAAALGETWDTFIAQHTRFPSWQEMLNGGATDYARRQLGF